MSSDLPASIRLREVGPRDGLQIEAPISTVDKISLLEALVAAGLRRIEATAFVSPRAVPALADAERVAERLADWPHVHWSALVANARGAHRALAAGVTNLEYVVSAADGHSRSNTRRSTGDAVREVETVADAVRGHGGSCEVIIATAWDCPFDGPTPVERVRGVASRAVAQGADRLCLADTIGTATPARVVRLIETVRETCPGVPVGLHMHNTRGQALAAIQAAMQIGVVDIDASVGGLGGCPFAPGASGNVATEELAYLCGDAGVHTGINLERLLDAAALAQRLVGRGLPSSLLRAGDRKRDRRTVDEEERRRG